MVTGNRPAFGTPPSQSASCRQILAANPVGLLRTRVRKVTLPGGQREAWIDTSRRHPTQLGHPPSARRMLDGANPPHVRPAAVSGLGQH
jgi:hypothetical protein